MEITNKYANLKKVYLVTSPFELTIDKKEATESGIPFTSIKMGLEKFIKNKIDIKSPPILSRAFLKLWELIIYFDLIPATNNFVSAHEAEGPGSFIQATILYRDLLEKENKIKSSKSDNYYAVTLHSENQHLLLEKEFINYYTKEKPKRLHILETISRKDIKEMYGGGKQVNQDVTDGDITRLHTINLFGGSNDKNGFSEKADFITADGGFDWKNENLQEQEAYSLIFSEILLALKSQKSGGNFVLKIFETYTKNTLKLIELVRAFYDEVIIAKPFTSRISNSEKYLVCKGYDRKKFTAAIEKKLENMKTLMSKNSQYNIIEIFSDFKLDTELLDIYKNINIQLTVEQYVGINKIIGFLNLDNKNGIEYNEYLDKQIIASTFWIDTFLEPNKYTKIRKFIQSYNSVKSNHFVKNELARNTPRKSKVKVYDEASNAAKKAFNINDYKKKEKVLAKSKSKSKSNKKKIGQKGGGVIGGADSDIEEETDDSDMQQETDSDESENSDNEYIEKVNEELDQNSEFVESDKSYEKVTVNQVGGKQNTQNTQNTQNAQIDLNAITSGEYGESEYELDEIIPEVKTSKSVKFAKGKAKSKINIV